MVRVALHQVEVWLTRLEETMKECVRAHLSEAVSVHEDRSREQWILDFPAQVALTGSQIWWNNDMELVFRRLEEGFESALKDYNKKQVHFRDVCSLTKLTRSSFVLYFREYDKQFCKSLNMWFPRLRDLKRLLNQKCWVTRIYKCRHNF